MNLSIIAAVGKNNVIGDGKRMPWNIPEDLAYFRLKTLGHNVIMGKKTWLSIGKPLDDRTNIVLSADLSFSYPGVIVCHSLEIALSYCGVDESFVIGGASIFEQFMPHVNKLYLTKIDGDFEGDRFFPQIDFSLWDQIYFEQQETQSGYTISFNEYLLKTRSEL
jgi:dihydrofolate reductase